MSLSSGFSSTGRSTGSPLTVTLHRGSIAESRHRVHAVVCDGRGRVLMAAGDPGHETFIRSALKPFQALPFISSGAAAQMDVGDRGLAISSASHCGSTLHAREAFKLLWNADLDANHLQCPVPSWGDSPLQHNCSGKHAAFLATCRKMGWPLESYLQQDHPLQQEIQRRVAEYYNVRLADMLSARRARAVARPRQVAMYLSKQLTTRSLPEIGRKFGGRDHTTVIHAVRKIDELCQVDSGIEEDVDLLRRMLEGGHGPN